MNKLSLEEIKSRIIDVKYIYEGLVTICIITFDNKALSVGKAICADPSFYSRELGADTAYHDALRESFPWFVFSMKEDDFQNA